MNLSENAQVDALTDANPTNFYEGCIAVLPLNAQQENRDPFDKPKNNIYNTIFKFNINSDYL